MQWLYCRALCQHLQHLLTWLHLFSILLQHRSSQVRLGLIDFVADQYRALSIKGCERDNRAKHGLLQVRIVSRHQKCPSQWKKYLSSSKNKVELQSFLLTEWQRPECAGRLN